MANNDESTATLEDGVQTDQTVITDDTVQDDQAKVDKDQSEKIDVLEKQVSELTGKLNRKETKADKVEVVKEEEKSEEFGLLQKTFLRSAGITDEDEVELAQEIQKQTGLDYDRLVEDDYFISKLEKLRDSKATADATSNIKGGKGTQEAKNTAEFWIAKGVPPSREDLPDNKLRRSIGKEMWTKAKSGGKTFYNE